MSPKNNEEKEEDGNWIMIEAPVIGIDAVNGARRLLYVSHLFATGSEVAWQFCLIFFLAAFTNYTSLVLVSTYGLFAALVVFVVGSHVGQYVDDTPRLEAAQFFIIRQNICVIIATLSCYMLFLQPSTSGIPSSMTAVVCLIGIHIFGAAANVLDRGLTVAVEKDWIVVMSTSVQLSDTTNDETSLLSSSSQEKNTKWLSETNIIMRQIDLACKAFGPALAGFLMAAIDTSSKTNPENHPPSKLRYVALIVGLLNLASLFVEWYCMTHIYQMVPSLMIKPKKSTPPQIQKNISSSSSIFCRLSTAVQNYVQKWKIYSRQTVSLGGFALSLLYVNVLTFHDIMTAYLVWRDMSLQSIGIWRGIASVIGLCGTIAYRYSIQIYSIETTGMWSIVYQFLCLTFAYLSLFYENSTYSTLVLVVGVCMSRIGLWTFDLSVTQLFQQHIPEEERGIVGGLQESLYAVFNFTSYSLGIIFAKPQHFAILSFFGYAGVGLAVLCYFFGIYIHQPITTPTTTTATSRTDTKKEDEGENVVE